MSYFYYYFFFCSLGATCVALLYKFSPRLISESSTKLKTVWAFFRSFLALVLFTCILIVFFLYSLSFFDINLSICNRIGCFCLIWFFGYTLFFDELYSFKFLLYDSLYDEDLFPPGDDIFSATFMNDYSDTEAFNSIIDATTPDGPPGMETFAPIFAQADDDLDLSYSAEDDYIEGIVDEFLEDTYHFSMLYPTSTYYYRSFLHPTNLTDYQISSSHQLYSTSVDFFQDHNLLTKSVLHHYLHSRLDLIRNPVLYENFNSSFISSDSTSVNDTISEVHHYSITSNLNALVWLLMSKGGFPFYLSRTDTLSLHVIDWELMLEEDLNLDIDETARLQQFTFPVRHEGFGLFKVGMFLGGNLLPHYDFYSHADWREFDEDAFIGTFDESEMRKRRLDPLAQEDWHPRDNLREFISNLSPWYRGFYLSDLFPESPFFLDSFPEDLMLRVLHNKLKFGSCFSLVNFFSLREDSSVIFSRSSDFTLRNVSKNSRPSGFRGLHCLPAFPLALTEKNLSRNLPLFIFRPTVLDFIDIKSLFLDSVEEKRPPKFLDYYLDTVTGAPLFKLRSTALRQPSFSFFVPYLYSFILPNPPRGTHLFPSRIGIPFLGSHLRRISPDPARVQRKLASFFDKLNAAIEHSQEYNTDKSSPYFGKLHPFEFSKRQLRHNFREDFFFLESLDFDEESFSRFDVDFDATSYLSRSDYMYNLTLSNVLEHNRIRPRWVKNERAKKFLFRYFVKRRPKKGRRVFLTQGRWRFGFTFPSFRSRRKNRFKRSPIYLTRVLRQHLRTMVDMLLALQTIQIPVFIFNSIYFLFNRVWPDARLSNAPFGVTIARVWPLLSYFIFHVYITLFNFVRPEITPTFFKGYRYARELRKKFKWNGLSGAHFLPLHFTFGKGLSWRKRFRFINEGDVARFKLLPPYAFTSADVLNEHNKRSLFIIARLKRMFWDIPIFKKSFKFTLREILISIYRLVYLIILYYISGFFLFLKLFLSHVYLFLCELLDFMSIMLIESRISNRFHAISNFANTILLSKFRVLFQSRGWGFLRARAANQSHFFNLFFKPINKTGSAFEANARSVFDSFDKPYISSSRFDMNSSVFVHIQDIQPHVESSYASDLFVVSLLSGLFYRQSRLPRLYRLGVNPTASFEFLPAFLRRKTRDTDFALKSMTSGFVLLHESYEVMDFFEDDLSVRLLLDSLGQELMSSIYTINFDEDPLVSLTEFKNQNDSIFAIRPLELLSDLEDYSLYYFDSGDDILSEDDIYHSMLDITEYFNIVYEPETFYGFRDLKNLFPNVTSFVLSNDLQMMMSFPYSLSALELVDEDFWVEDLHLLDDEIYSHLEFLNLGFILQSLDLSNLWESADDGEYSYVDESVLFKHSWIFFIFLTHFTFCHIIGDYHHYYSWMEALGSSKVRSSLGLSFYSPYYDHEGVDNIAEPSELDYLLYEEEFELDTCSEFGLQDDPLSRFYEFLEPFDDQDMDVDTWDLLFEIPKILYTDLPFDMVNPIVRYLYAPIASQHNYFSDSSMFHFQHELLPLNRQLQQFSNHLYRDSSSNFNKDFRDLLEGSSDSLNMSTSSKAKLLSYMTQYNLNERHATFESYFREHDTQFVILLYHFIKLYFPSVAIQEPSSVFTKYIPAPLSGLSLDSSYFTEQFTPTIFLRLYFALYRISRLSQISHLFLEIPLDKLLLVLRNLWLANSHTLALLFAYSDPHRILSDDLFNTKSFSELVLVLRQLLVNSYIQDVSEPLIHFKNANLPIDQLPSGLMPDAFSRRLHVKFLRNKSPNKFWNNLQLLSPEVVADVNSSWSPSKGFESICNLAVACYFNKPPSAKSLFDPRLKTFLEFPFFKNLWLLKLNDIYSTRLNRDSDYFQLFEAANNTKLAFSNFKYLRHFYRTTFYNLFLQVPPQDSTLYSDNLLNSSTKRILKSPPISDVDLLSNFANTEPERYGRFSVDVPLDLSAFFLDINDFLFSEKKHSYTELHFFLHDKTKLLNAVDSLFKGGFSKREYLDKIMSSLLESKPKEARSFFDVFQDEDVSASPVLLNYSSNLENIYRTAISTRRLFEFPLKMTDKYRRGPLVGHRLKSYRESIELIDRSREISQEQIRQGLHHLTTAGPELFFYKNDPILFDFLKENQSLFLFDFLQAYNTFYSYLSTYPRIKHQTDFRKAPRYEYFLPFSGFGNPGSVFMFSYLPDGLTASGHKMRFDHLSNFRFGASFDLIKSLKRLRVYDFLFTQYLNTYMEDDLASYFNSDGIFEVFTDDAEDITAEDDALFTTFTAENASFSWDPLIDYDPDTVNIYLYPELKDLLIDRQLDEHGSFERDATFQTLYWSQVDYDIDYFDEDGERVEQQVDHRPEFIAFPEELFTSSHNFDDDITLTYDFERNWRRFKGQLGSETFKNLVRRMQETPVEEYPIEISELADDQFWDHIFDPNSALLTNSILPKFKSSFERAHNFNLNVHVDQFAWAGEDNNIELDLHPWLSNYNFIDRPLFRFLRGQDPTFFEDFFGINFSPFFLNNLFDFWHLGGYDSYPSFSNHYHNVLYPNLFYTSNPYLNLPFDYGVDLSSSQHRQGATRSLGDMHDFTIPFGLDNFNKDNNLLQTRETFDLERNLSGFSSDEFLKNLSLGDLQTLDDDRELFWQSRDRRFFDAFAFSDDLLSDFRSTPAWPFFLFSRLSALGNFTPPTVNFNNFGLTISNEAYHPDMDESEEGSDEFVSHTQDETEREALIDSLGEGFYSVIMALEDVSDFSDYLLPGFTSDINNPSTFSFREFFRIFRVISTESRVFWSDRWFLYYKNLTRLGFFIENYERRSFRLFFKYYFQRYVMYFWLLFLQLIGFLIQFLQVFFFWLKGYVLQCVEYIFLDSHHSTSHTSFFFKDSASFEFQKFSQLLDDYCGLDMRGLYLEFCESIPGVAVYFDIWSIFSDDSLFLLLIDNCIAYGGFFFCFLALVEVSSFYLTNDMYFGSTDEDSYYTEEQYAHEMFRKEMGSLDGNIAFHRSKLFGTIEQTNSDMSPLAKQVWEELKPHDEFYSTHQYDFQEKYHTNIQHFFNISDLQHWFPDVDEDSDVGFETDVLMDEDDEDDIIESHPRWDLSDFFHQLEATRQVLLSHKQDPFLVFNFDESRVVGNFEEVILYASTASGFLYTYDPIDIFTWNLSRKQLLLFAETLFTKLRQFSIGLNNISVLVPDNHSLVSSLSTSFGMSPYESMVPELTWGFEVWKERLLEPTSPNFSATDLWNLRVSSWSRSLGWSEFGWYSQMEQLADDNYYSSLLCDGPISKVDNFDFVNYSHLLNQNSSRIRVFFVDCFWSLIQDRLELNRRFFYSKLTNKVASHKRITRSAKSGRSASLLRSQLSQPRASELFYSDSFSADDPVENKPIYDYYMQLRSANYAKTLLALHRKSVRNDLIVHSHDLDSSLAQTSPIQEIILPFLKRLELIYPNYATKLKAFKGQYFGHVKRSPFFMKAWLFQPDTFEHFVRHPMIWPIFQTFFPLELERFSELKAMNLVTLTILRDELLDFFFIFFDYFLYCYATEWIHDLAYRSDATLYMSSFESEALFCHQSSQTFWKWWSFASSQLFNSDFEGSVSAADLFCSSHFGTPRPLLIGEFNFGSYFLFDRLPCTLLDLQTFPETLYQDLLDVETIYQQLLANGSVSSTFSFTHMLEHFGVCDLTLLGGLSDDDLSVQPLQQRSFLQEYLIWFLLYHNDLDEDFVEIMHHFSELDITKLPPSGYRQLSPIRKLPYWPDVESKESRNIFIPEFDFPQIRSVTTGLVAQDSQECYNNFRGGSFDSNLLWLKFFDSISTQFQDHLDDLFKFSPKSDVTDWSAAQTQQYNAHFQNFSTQFKCYPFLKYLPSRKVQERLKVRIIPRLNPLRSLIVVPFFRSSLGITPLIKSKDVASAEPDDSELEFADYAERMAFTKARRAKTFHKHLLQKVEPLWEEQYESNELLRRRWILRRYFKLISFCRVLSKSANNSQTSYVNSESFKLFKKYKFFRILSYKLKIFKRVRSRSGSVRSIRIGKRPQIKFRFRFSLAESDIEGAGIRGDYFLPFKAKLLYVYSRLFKMGNLPLLYLDRLSNLLFYIKFLSDKHYVDLLKSDQYLLGFRMLTTLNLKFYDDLDSWSAFENKRFWNQADLLSGFFEDFFLFKLMPFTHSSFSNLTNLGRNSGNLFLDSFSFESQDPYTHESLSQNLNSLYPKELVSFHSTQYLSGDLDFDYLRLHYSSWGDLFPFDLAYAPSIFYTLTFDSPFINTSEFLSNDDIVWLCKMQIFNWKWIEDPASTTLFESRILQYRLSLISAATMRLYFNFFFTTSQSVYNWSFFDFSFKTFRLRFSHFRTCNVSSVLFKWFMFYF